MASVGGGNSKQDYGTPPELLAAIERRFGRILLDLAANGENHVAPYWLGPGSALGEDALKVSWEQAWAKAVLAEQDEQCQKIAFLNPPFKNIYPWADLCMRYSTWEFPIVAIWPASIDTRWFNDLVRPHTTSFGISRPKFVGMTTGFPKTMMLSWFCGLPRENRPLGDLWNWKLRRTKRKP